MREIVNTIPQLLSTLIYFSKVETAEEGLWTLILTIVILAFYSLVVYKLLFNTNYLLDKLKLDQGFNQQEFSFNISTSPLLTLALIVIGGILLTDEIPNLCRQLFSYFQEKRMTYGMTNPDFSFSIIAASKIFIGLLLIGERKRIVRFIKTRQKTNVED